MEKSTVILPSASSGNSLSATYSKCESGKTRVDIILKFILEKQNIKNFLLLRHRLISHHQLFLNC